MAKDGRTIVFSDAHGEPAIIRSVVEHSGYDPECDRLVFAGDAVEVGRDSWGCLQLLDELGAECLVGNHEYSVFVGWDLEGAPVESRVHDAVCELITSGAWNLAAVADGVLITHAGVADGFAEDFEVAGGGAVDRFVDALNEEFAGAVELGPMATEGVIDVDGPLWYRPSDDAPPLPDVVQVAGHTPPELFRRMGRVLDSTRAAGMHFVDPWVRGWQMRAYTEPTPVRYAVIENGTVTLVEQGV